MITLRIFVSSPGDVGEERRLAARVIERLQLEWSGAVRLEPIFWEHEPLRATKSFQEQIPRPSQSDVVVCILWSRLGTRLPPQLVRPDGTAYASGTEFEFEDAVSAYLERGVPDLLVYRKMTRAVADLGSEEQVLERLAQKKAVDAFVEKWFRDREGSFTAAFHGFDAPARFEELLEEHLRRLIEGRVRREASGEVPRPLWAAGSPFRGLETFDVEHAAVFCGRTAQVGDVLAALRRQAAAGRPFVLVTGPSGCGKSSLVRAGVLPELTDPNVIEGIGLWRRAILLPGAAAGDLTGGLARALLAQGALAELEDSGMRARELGLLLAERPETAVPMIRSGLAQAAREVARLERLEREPAARLALLVDQLEELFTAEGVTAAERERFDAALGALARSGVVWVLATLRSDFYSRLSELPEVLRLKEGAGQYDLSPPGPAEIGQMIRQPARIAGLAFEEDPATGERLDDALRDAAAREPGALPLLEFTLDELFKRRSRERVLTFAAYRELAGLEGALAHRAEEVFAGLPPAAQAALPPVLAALVTLGTDEEAAVTRRRAPLAAVAAAPGAKALVDAFVAERLLVTDRLADGTATVSVAHEALLQRWPRAQEWLRQNEAQLKTAARLKAAAAIWQQEGEAVGHLLPEGRLLADGQALLAGAPGHLGAAEAKLVAASLAAAEERRRRRHRHRLAAAAAAALVLVLAGMAAWLWLVPHQSYYANMTKRWGVPEGVGEVSAGEAEHRQWTLRFHRRGRLGPVTLVEAVNGTGELTPLHLLGRLMAGADEGPQLGGERECAWEFEYDERGRPAREVAHNCNGRVVYEFQYKGRAAADGAVMAEFTRDGVAAPQARSGAALAEFTRDASGFDKKVRYFDNDGSPRPGSDGSYGQAVEELDADGLPLAVVNLGPDGYPAVHLRGWVKAVTRYDERGQPVEGSFLGLDGRPAVTGLGFASATVTYDRYGNVAEAKLFDEHRQPMRGVAITRSEYDRRGNLVRVTFFDGEGRPAHQAQGAFGIAREYDGEGRMVAESYLDERGRPSAVGGGVAALRMTYDERGNLKTLTLLDTAGRPTSRAGGFAQIASDYDEAGNVVEQRYLDGRSRIVRPENGVAVVEKRYDPRRNQIEEAYFDERREPTRNPDGIMRWQADYDPIGHLVEQRYLDQAGEPMESFRGEAMLKRTYDAAGNVVEEAYFDLNGRPTAVDQGYAKTRSRYDEAARTTEIAYFDAAELPVVVGGCARVRTRRDVRDQSVQVTCLDTGGVPTVAAAGWTTRRIHYDELGHEVGESYFDAGGEPVASADGVARVRWKCDRAGNKVEETYFDESGQPTLHPRGQARLTKRYDDWGKVVEEASWDVEGRPVRARDGYARVSRSYGERGELLEESYADEHGGSARVQLGYTRSVFSYDERGRPAEITFLDVDGEPLRSGAARATFEHGLGGRARLLVRDRSGAVLHVAELDRLGNVVEARGQAVPAADRPPAPPRETMPQRAASPPPPRPVTQTARANARQAPAPPPPPRAGAGAPAGPGVPTGPPTTGGAPSGGLDDLGAVVNDLVALAERAAEQYEEHMDEAGLEGEAEERLLERLEAFAEAAAEVRKAFRQATGQGGGFRNRLGLNAQTAGTDQAIATLRRRSGDLARAGAEIDGLAAGSPLGPQAGATWQEVRRDLRRLEAMVR